MLCGKQQSPGSLAAGRDRCLESDVTLMETAHHVDGLLMDQQSHQWGRSLEEIQVHVALCFGWSLWNDCHIEQQQEFIWVRIFCLYFINVCCFEQNSYAGLFVKSMTYRFRKTGLTHSCVTQKLQFLCQSNEPMWILTRLGEEIKGPNPEEHSLKLLKALFMPVIVEGHTIKSTNKLSDTCNVLSCLRKPGIVILWRKLEGHYWVLYVDSLDNSYKLCLYFLQRSVFQTLGCRHYSAMESMSCCHNFFFT